MDDVPALSVALARAFDGDPPMRWFLQDASRRVEQARFLFDVMLRKLHIGRDECYTTADVVGGALWAPPGAARLTLLQQLSLLPGMLRIFGRSLGRAQRGLAVIDAGHPREPHYYLDTLGVDPDWQGRGLGSALMRPVLERCDRERMPAYLNAGSPRSRALYLRHGFTVKEEFRLPDEGPPLWRMWRTPRPRESTAD